MLRVVRPSGLVVVVSLLMCFKQILLRCPPAYYYTVKRAATAAVRTESTRPASPSDSSSSLSALPPLASVVVGLGVGGGASLLSPQNGAQPCLSSSVDSVPGTESENE